MRHLFLDANILVDLLMKRESHEEIQKIIESEESQIYISPLSIHITIYTLKLKPDTEYLEKLKNLIATTCVIPLTNIQVSQSFKTGYKDFEDMLQFFSAVEFCDTILTRDKKDFENIKKLTKSKINIISPK